ncbi:MAG: hypothetical protein FWC47_05885 [Oscillospiraceae bacterium]|nr:hypothetical protein [Oscillospiraceae bacterium]
MADKKDSFENNNKIKRAQDWPFPLTDEMIVMIDRMADIVEAEGCKPPEAGKGLPQRWEYLHLQRDIKIEARSTLWRDENKQADIIRYYCMDGMFK